MTHIYSPKCIIRTFFARLLDVRDPNNFNGTIPLPLLRHRPGISHWHCSPEAFTVGEKDAGEKMKSLKKLPPILPTMYPPSKLELYFSVYSIYAYTLMLLLSVLLQRMS